MLEDAVRVSPDGMRRRRQRSLVPSRGRSLASIPTRSNNPTSRSQMASPVPLSASSKNAVAEEARDAAAERAKQLAPALASVPPAKLADSLKDADPSQIAGTLNALVHEGKAASNLLRAMPKAAQKRAAARMLEACPEGTAGAILGDFTGDECAALMAGLSPDEHAEALAELCRENPKKACAALGAMNPEEASRAMSLVVAAANNGTGRARLSDASRTNLFKCCPPDVLKGIQPATALGSMCASTMSASEAAAVLGKLEPNAAAACLEGMSGEEVRQVLEASAGDGNRDTPLVAAMVPYMASLDAAGAAAMIEALPPDIQQRFRPADVAFLRSDSRRISSIVKRRALPSERRGLMAPYRRCQARIVSAFRSVS